LESCCPQHGINATSKTWTASSNLMKLRAVTFRYKQDPKGERQYGLMAEEVAKVYPELVTYGPDGKIESVRYLTLTAMLLNELQKQATEMARQTTQMQTQTGANQRQAEQIKKLGTQMVQERTSTERKIAQLQANHDRELRAVQAAFEQRLSALERSTGAGAPAPVKF
jgi:septal ring factor EnvC (AmiA/AmiB activator)